MANKHRGEVALEIEGKVYTLHAGINAVADAEGVFSTADRRVTYQEIAEHAMKGSVTHIRALIWAMLRKHHRDLSLPDVGDLIDLVGMTTIEQKFADLLRSTVPDAEDLKAMGVDPNPPQAQGGPRAGTSKVSTRKRVASA
jgi:hypothetical protein